MDDSVDWHKILKRYIIHVGSTEGIDFLGNDDTTSVDGLAEEENRALAKARDEAWAEHAKKT